MELMELRALSFVCISEAYASCKEDGDLHV
jgi:hypothetical protein